MTRSVKHYWLDYDGHWHGGVDIKAWVVLVFLGLLQLPYMLLFWLLVSPCVLWMYLRRKNKDVELVRDMIIPLFKVWVVGIGKD